MYFLLNVPYREKDEAKRFGARWNGKSWYYQGESLPGELKRWLRAETAGPSRTAVSPAAPAAEDVELERYQSVKRINELIAGQIRSNILLRNIWVIGEVCNFSGHTNGRAWFFSVKDPEAEQEAVLPCLMWDETAAQNLNFELQNGQMVALIGSVEYWEKQGRTTFLVQRIRYTGEGAAALALLKLKAKLEQEGLFDPEKKKEIPVFPKKVGILTAQGGQAIRDICQKAKERDPYVQLVLYPVSVQGQFAVPELLRGLRVMDAYGCDTLIIGRGGGSQEDLSAFNDEALVRAVYAAKTPIISAVGHQGNFTLIDYAADLRVSTPTSAAEKAIPDVMRDVRRILEREKSLRFVMHQQFRKRQVRLDNAEKLLSEREKRQLQEKQHRLELASARLKSLSPAARLQARRERLSREEERLRIGVRRMWERKMSRLELLISQLNGLSPTAKLVKGYGYISFEEKPLTSVQALREGDLLTVRIHDGQADARVTSVRKNNAGGKL